MPAIVENGSYHHVFNKGVEGRTIFSDNQDYETFLGYLKDYLSAPPDSEAAKETFTVHGRTFRGTPHQHKNYLGKVELIAYSLLPRNFHLLLFQKAPGSLQAFIRSLCTRYSIYYNKKYQHTGGLFDGPYKSVRVEEISQLMLLTKDFHRNEYSSYAEYTGKRDTPWVNTNVILSVKEITDYRYYVEKYKLNPKEQEELEKISFDNGILERREVQSVPTTPQKAVPVQNLKPFSRTPEILAFFAFFMILTGLGVRSISISKVEGMTTSSETQSPVLSATTQASATPEPTASPVPKSMVIIKITDGATSVNIRETPSTTSPKVGKAMEGDIFEFISQASGWYEVKLADGSIGYISSKYVVSLEPTNP